MLTQLMLQILIGLTFGLLLFLVASGFTLIFGLARFVNVAHGAIFLASAYVATSITGPGAFGWAVLAATGIGAALSVLVYVIARVRWQLVARSDLTQVLYTFGILLITASIVRTIWHGLPRTLSPPDFLRGTVSLGFTTFPAYRLFVALVAIVLAAGIWLLTERTKFGALIRAGVHDRQMLEGSGRSAQPLFFAVFAISGALAGIAGAMGSPLMGAAMGQEFSVLLLAFVIVVVGGPGNLKGAFIASIVVGIADSIGKAYLPTFAEFVIMGLVVVVLAWRPAGLFGRTS